MSLRLTALRASARSARPLPTDMRRSALSAGAAALMIGAFDGSAAAEPARYEIDPAHFSVVFNADHIGYAPTWGMFLRGGGGFTFDETALALSDLEVTVEAASVFTNHDGRDNHLRGNDFLMADAHPDIRFVMTNAVATDDRKGEITGDLTIRGVTKPVTLEVVWNKSDTYPFGGAYVIGITATTTIKRSEWGMTYAIDGGLVGDDVPIVIELEAIRQD